MMAALTDPGLTGGHQSSGKGGLFWIFNVLLCEHLWRGGGSDLPGDPGEEIYS